MYRNLRDNTITELEWQDGKLRLNKQTALEPVAAGRFAAGSSEQEFQFEEGTPARLRLVTANGDTIFERVTPAEPTAAELAAAVGEYESSETGAILTVAPGAKAGELSYRVGGNTSVVLRPATTDVFVTPAGAAIRFIRDSSGKITSLSAGEGRVWDLRFQRVR
jgi:hypothetical protein